MIEVLKQALADAKLNERHQTIAESYYWLRALVEDVIAELESQEPVATVTSETGADITMSWWHEPALPMGTKLFTHPPQRTWVGLTSHERMMCRSFYPDEAVAKTEAKLKELNT
jgi:hypothetical protein